MTDDEAKLLNSVQRHEFQKALAYGKTRQGSFENTMLHLDHPLFAGGQDLTADDGGKGAADIRNIDDGECPLWLKLWRQKRAKMSKSHRRILNALSVDWRTVHAARIAHVSTATVKREKTFLKKVFAQCFQAWKRDFGR